MRWPLVSVRVVDALMQANASLNLAATQAMSERDYLREQLRDALDHARRLERRDAGLTEKPREARPAAVAPARITKIAERFGAQATRDGMVSGAMRYYADIRPRFETDADAWDTVASWLVEQLNVPEVA